MPILFEPLVAALRFSRGATAGGHLDQSKAQHFLTLWQRYDIARLDGEAVLLNPAAVHPDMSGLYPALRQRPAFGEPEEKEQLVDPQRA